jgi:hypothetical protein
MMTNMDMSVYRKVVSGEYTPEQGREVFMAAQRKETLLKQPSWMPKPIFVLLVIIGAFIFAPVMAGRDRA